MGGLVLELTGKITALLEKDYLVDPQVTINISEYNSQKIYVLGSVYKPGVYPLKRETTILQYLINVKVLLKALLYYPKKLK